MKRIACFIFILVFICQAEAQTTTRTYKFIHLTDKNNMLADYIQLVFDNDSIVKGTYYGNEDGFHYKGDIEFRNIKSEWYNISFSVLGCTFSKEMASPFEKVEYSYFFEMEKNIPLELRYDIDFLGNISSEKLDLQRTLVLYMSRSDKMIFTLEKTE
ncbi:hypothetical protein AAEO56_10985 [Flavobacterium sp. DGU11]|uniref:Uncharacterized protein n=1 Tax=Flavobacterium arundinis TaxID=3139143 RepID=A0ABU9HX97_9FLAO